MNKPVQTLGGGAVVTAAPSFTAINTAAQTAVTILTLPSDADYIYIVEITGTINVFSAAAGVLNFNILTPGAASYLPGSAGDVGAITLSANDVNTTALNLSTHSKEYYGTVKLLMGPGAAVTTIVSYSADVADASRTLNYSLAATYLGIKINN